MSKLRRIFIMIISGILSLLLLTSCTVTPGSTPANTDEPEKPTEEPTPDGIMPGREFDDELPRVQPPENTHFHFETVDTGFNVYCAVEGKWGYRYAPSILYYPDGTMDAWFATPGTSGEWDWFTWKHSDDGGKTWSEEKLVLQPTPDSMDHYSVCDPGVIYFGGWYYLGYTSTIVSTNGGINNNVFVARSRKPDGPYEKWNGNGWGGDPQPIIYYNEADASWGAGEPSFVELDGKLYIYYTWASDVGEYEYVSIADSTSENWPATMEFKGMAFKKTGDQFDVCYCEDVGLFLGVQTYNRFTTSSGIQLYESKDGIHFIKGEFIKKNIAQMCHNMGISKRSNGHIQLKDNLMLGYAFAPGVGNDFWGKWATRFVFINLETYQGDLRKETKSDKNVLITDAFWPPVENPVPEGLTTLPHLVKVSEGSTYGDLDVAWIDSNIKTHKIVEDADVAKISFSNYDTSLIKFDGKKIVALKEGKTEVTATYEGYSITFKVYVYPENFVFDQSFPDIESVTAVQPEITIYNGKANGAKHKPQVRGLVKFVDDTWGECYNDSTKKHADYPAMVPSEHYPVTYTSSDTGIVTVTKTGQLQAKGLGDAVVTAQIGDDPKNSYTVTVHVVEPPAEFNWSEADYKW